MLDHFVKESNPAARSVPELCRGIGRTSRNPTLALWKELVLFNDRSHGHFAVCAAIFNADYAPFALHADTFRERDFGRQGKSEADGRPLRDG